MSRDIFIQDIPPGIRSVADIPRSWRPAPLQFGHAEVVAAVLELWPWSDFSDPARGHVEFPGVDIEVNVGEGSPLVSFALHDRSADRVAGDRFVAQLLDRLGARAFDPANETGLFVAP